MNVFPIAPADSRADGLRLEGDLYERLVPRSALRVDLASRANLGCI